MGNYKCQRPIHPGELLKEEVGNRKLPQTKLAAQTGISYKVLNDILNCRRPLTTSTALLFEAALGISAGLLMRMQLDYNMQLAESDQTLMERLKQHCSKQNVTAKPLHIFCSTAANIYAVPLQHIYSGTAKKLAVAGK